MTSVYLNIAGFTVKLLFPKQHFEFYANKITNDIKVYLKGFIHEGVISVADFTVTFIHLTHYRIIFPPYSKKAFINFYHSKTKNHIVTYTHISMPQFQLLLQNILLYLLKKKNGFLLHASASRINGKANIFTGNSGSGKSTAISLLHPRFSALADDSAIIRRQANRYYLYQTPFREKETWIKKSNKRYEIGKIFFLRKAPYCQMTKINHKKVIASFIEQLWLETEYQNVFTKRAMTFVSQFRDFYQLAFFNEKQKLISLFLA